jgi:very-short-patch-repair endonuclease
MDSEAERRFYEAMLERGLNPISKFNVEGYELDFGIIEGDLRLDLEVDGDQHYESVAGQHLRLRRQDITRDGVLTRAGWQVLRVPAWLCFTNPSLVVSDVQDVIARHRQG